MAFIPDEAVLRSRELTPTAWDLYCFHCMCRDHSLGVSNSTTVDAIERMHFKRSMAYRAHHELIEKHWIAPHPESGFRLLVGSFEVVDERARERGRKAGKSSTQVDKKSTVVNNADSTVVEEKSTPVEKSSTQVDKKSTVVESHIKDITSYQLPAKPAKTDKRAKAVTAKRGSRIPQPFLLTQTMRKWAEEETPDVDTKEATAEFVDYWRAIPGAKGTKLDWEATWRNRMRDQQRRITERKVRSNGANQKNTRKGPGSDRETGSTVPGDVYEREAYDPWADKRAI